MSDRQGMDAWRRADALFDQWLDIGEEQREAWLADQALDADVRDRLQRLIDAHVSPRAMLATQPSDLTGLRLGAWTLESELGRGGMAVVYRASRSNGMARQDAAIKVLTLGALGATGRDRFQREAEILARLNHPNITPLVDSGTGPDGTCWLAMPLVDGQRIDAWCDRQGLDARGVTRLFLQVCDAVAFAHRNLVIHRDLKPSNVLVEADGHVRLLDFGIGQFADAEGERTQTMWRALTPGYAAPEQMRGDLPTTAIDIYGLGALLHRLLTGRTPQASDERTATTRPSLLVRDASDAYHRHYVPLKNDLDRVLLKALAEEPERRYHSAEALADDLRRWLDGMPVLARQPGLGYRARKFVGRNKVGVAAGVLLAASLAGGIGATLWQAREARQEAERALAARNFMVQLFEASDPDVAQGRVITARELLDQGAHQVRAAFVETPRLRAEMLLLLGELYVKTGEGSAGAPLLHAGLDLARSERDPALTAQGLAALGKLYMAESRHADALTELRAAADLLASIGQVPGEQHAHIVHEIAGLLANTGQPDAAVEYAEAALAHARTHGASQGALFYYMFALSNAVDMTNTSDPERVDRLLRDALALKTTDSLPPSYRMRVHSMLSLLALNRGDLDEAHAQTVHMLELVERVYRPMHPDRVGLLVNGGLVLLHTGRLEEAERTLRQALSIQEAMDPAHRDLGALAGTYNNLALVLEAAERDDEVEPFLSGARDMALELFGREDMRYTTSTGNLGALYRRLGRLDDAEPLLIEAVDLRRQLLGDSQPPVGAALAQLAYLRLDQDRPADALALADETLGIYATANSSDPRRTAQARVIRATALARLGRTQEAEELFERIVADGRAAGIDSGVQWANALAARADLALDQGAAGASQAVAAALDAARRTFGDEHPRTRRYAALVGPD